MAPKKKSAGKGGGNALLKIQEYAKEIKKEHPDMKYSECVKRGSERYRQEKK